MSWHTKSVDSDLFFCVNEDCNVITFRPGPLGQNVCPKCWILGSVVRHQKMLLKGIPGARIEEQEGTS